jgi:hypothetical protein
MTGANRCPGCGAERTADGPEGLCPRCLMSPTKTGDTPGPSDLDATTAPSATSSGYPREPSPGDFEATGAYNPGPAAGAASSRTDATGDWTTDSDDPTRTTDPDSPTRTADGHFDTHDMPRGATVRYFGD